MKIETIQRPARIALAGLALTVFGCEQEANHSPGVQTNTTIERQTPPEVASEQLSQITVDKFYPELKDTDYKVKSTLILESEKIPTRFYNFTQHNFNASAISGMYKNAEYYAQLPDPILLPSPLGPDGSQIVMVGQPNIKSRTIVILSADMPSPFSNNELTQRIKASAATKKDASGEDFTFIRVVPGTFEYGSFSSAEANATLGMSIEMCQQIFIAGVVDSAGNLIKDVEKTQYAQELACNGFGAAIASRILGHSYQD